MAKHSDKRRHHRPLALLDVKVLPGSGWILPADLKLATIDVAVGGARCASNLPLEPDTRLRLTLTLEGGELREPSTVVADARVLRCTDRPGQPEIRRYDLALEFERMAPQEKKTLERYLNSL